MDKKVHDITLESLEAPEIVKGLQRFVDVTNERLGNGEDEFEVLNDFLAGISGFSEILTELVVKGRDLDAVAIEWKERHNG